MSRQGLACGLLPLLLAALNATAQPAGEALLACPESIRLLPEVALAEAPDGWRERAWPEYHFLDGARLFDGDPAAMVELVPDFGEGRDHSWAFDPDDSSVLVCTYEGTEVSLEAPVPAGASLCEVRFVPDDSRGVRFRRVVTPDELVTVTCR